MSDWEQERRLLIAQLKEAEAVIRALLLSTSYEHFQRQRRVAERTRFTLRDLISKHSDALSVTQEIQR